MSRFARDASEYHPGMSTTASIDAGTRSGAVLNVSLVGAGFIGRVHAQCIAANAATRLAAVFETDESAAEALAARHGARVAGSLGKIADSGETDAVVIASSTDSHGEIARACAHAGKPFLCEKPLDTHRDAAVETVRYVRVVEAKQIVDVPVVEPVLDPIDRSPTPGSPVSQPAAPPRRLLPAAGNRPSLRRTPFIGRSPYRRPSRRETATAASDSRSTARRGSGSTCARRA